MTDTISVLVIEDEESFVEALVVGLKREGFLVTVARDGVEGLELFERSRPDLILLDLWLPKKSGIDVCREIRTRSKVPIIMVTAKSSEIDTVVGLEVGADDYVTKPFRLRELVARMRAVMRRTGASEGTVEVGETIDIDGLSLDPERHEVHLGGELVSLPLKEFELLELLMSNAGRVLTRETLIDRIWGPNYVGDTKTLDVHIKRLRAKVEADPSRPARITTVRGLGYKFEIPRSA
ncbi:MAG: response regulator transcription factor [Acidobacteriota bacterium]|nr:response regulator transcription factor [Acidobacteriota bacterium]